MFQIEICTTNAMKISKNEMCTLTICNWIDLKEKLQPIPQQDVLSKSQFDQRIQQLIQIVFNDGGMFRSLRLENIPGWNTFFQMTFISHAKQNTMNKYITTTKTMKLKI